MILFLPFSAEISVEFLMGHSDLYAYFSAKEVKKKNNLNMKGSTFIS